MIWDGRVNVMFYGAKMLIGVGDEMNVFHTTNLKNGQTSREGRTKQHQEYRFYRLPYPISQWTGEETHMGQTSTSSRKSHINILLLFGHFFPGLWTARVN